GFTRRYRGYGRRRFSRIHHREECRSADLQGLMKKLLFVTALVFCFLLPASAQTPKFKYEFTKFGAPFPNASGKRADTASVAADGKGLIFVLRRSDPPVLVYNREGKLVNSWGTGIFVDDHNIDVDRFGFVWIGD